MLGEGREPLETQPDNAICFRDGCDPQTHQDNATHSRRRGMHVFSSLTTPEGTNPPWALGGVCILESADSTNNASHTTPFAREHALKTETDSKGNRAPVVFIDMERLFTGRGGHTVSADGKQYPNFVRPRE
jgi:hypothetical protein